MVMKFQSFFKTVICSSKWQEILSLELNWPLSQKNNYYTMNKLEIRLGVKDFVTTEL